MTLRTLRRLALATVAGVALAPAAALAGTPPPSSDCDAAGDIGTIKIGQDGDYMYACQAQGDNNLGTPAWSQLINKDKFEMISALMSGDGGKGWAAGNTPAAVDDGGTVRSPVNPGELATKQYVDTAAGGGGGGYNVSTYKFTSSKTDGSFDPNTICGAGWRLGTTNDLWELNQQGIYPTREADIDRAGGPANPKIGWIMPTLWDGSHYAGQNGPIYAGPSENVRSMSDYNNCLSYTSGDSNDEGTVLGRRGITQTMGCSAKKHVFCVQ